MFIILLHLHSIIILLFYHRFSFLFLLLQGCAESTNSSNTKIALFLRTFVFDFLCYFFKLIYSEYEFVCCPISNSRKLLSLIIFTGFENFMFFLHIFTVHFSSLSKFTEFVTLYVYIFFQQ